MNIRLGPLWIHNLEQWDLGYKPRICVHWRYANGCGRLLCIKWSGLAHNNTTTEVTSWSYGRLLPIVLIVGVVVGLAGISICRASGQASRAEEDYRHGQ